MKSSNYILFMALVAMALAVRTTWSADCSTAFQDILPCQGYLLGGDPTPSSECCHGAQDVANIADSSKENFQNVCECLKGAAKSLPIDLPKAKQLPQLCNISLNITIDPNIDCTKSSGDMH